MAYEKQLIRFGQLVLKVAEAFAALVNPGHAFRRVPLEKLCRISKASEAVALADEVIVVLERCDEGSRQSGSLMKP